MPQLDAIEPARTALLLMDLQPVILDRLPADVTTPYLGRLAEAAAAARTAGVKVIYVVVAFRPGYPEISPRNLAFSGAVKASGGFVTEEIHAAVAPADGEPVVVKRRVSAFTGSDLEVILRANDINHLVLTGIATSGVVLSTLRQAADADYRLTVLEDGCLDFDGEVHSVLVDKIFPRQATIVSVQTFVDALTA
jgi:nicotinamidase-related amidase